jgi:hypothetical protein
MKFFVVGLHSSGKSDVIDFLEKKGIKCGHIFSDLETIKESIYGSTNYESYTIKDVNEVFENDAYIFVQECKHKDIRYYEGLSKYSFEHNEVFYLSPDQLVKCSFTNINEPICFIWLDNTRSHRLTKHTEDRRTYNFKQREELETQDLSTFVKIIYSKPHLYFSNEDPIRVAAIIYTMITSPESQNIFFSNFNN